MAKNWNLLRRRQELYQRAKIIQSIRKFFIERGYLEVETPYLLPLVSPEAHIDPVACGSWFLHTSPELCMKRLLSAGYEKIFQICHCWRQGERGSRHIPEFTMLEWYKKGVDYKELMKETEELIIDVYDSFSPFKKIYYQNKEIDISIPWERISVEEAFNRFGKIRLKEALEKDIFDEVMVEKIEPELGVKKPTFIYDYPIERASFSKAKTGDPSFAERFELYIGGVEIANGFSELTDPQEQRRRFEIENNIRKNRSKFTIPIPERFLEEISQMSQSSGIALGIDRLVMVFLDKDSIDKIVAFPPEEL